MGHTYTSCLMHCVFSTKVRQKALSTDLRDRLWPYLGGIARENGIKALAVGGTDDHVHLLLSLPATMSIAKAIQLIKGGSSKWIHDTFATHTDFAWQAGYGAFSVAVSGIDQTVAYINRQEAHHQMQSFRDELVGFLERHGIPYDERYVFG